eukprot:353919-Chlamydomonas_euryale.AAC.13
MLDPIVRHSARLGRVRVLADHTEFQQHHHAAELDESTDLLRPASRFALVGAGHPSRRLRTRHVVRLDVTSRGRSAAGRQVAAAQLGGRQAASFVLALDLAQLPTGFQHCPSPCQAFSAPTALHPCLSTRQAEQTLHQRLIPDASLCTPCSLPG